MIGGSPAAISDTGWTTTSPSRSLRSVPRCAFVFASSGLGPRFIVEAYGRRHGQHPRREPEKKAGRREAQRPTNVLADADRQRDGFHILDGLLIITYDESNGPTGDATACCGEKASVSQLLLQPGILGPGGGRVGAVLLSPFITPGTVSTLPYNHYSLLRSVADIFGVGYLGHAADGDSADGVPCDNTRQPCSFGSDVYSRQLPVFPPRPAS